MGLPAGDPCSGHRESILQRGLMVTRARLATITGWLLVVGPLVDVIVSTVRPGSFPAEHAEGPQAAMQAAILSLLPNSSLATFLTVIGFVASFGLLLGLWGVREVMADTGDKGLLRSIGFLFLTVALAVRTASFALSYLTTVTLSYSPSEAIESGEAVTTAVMFMVIGGSIGIFATVLALVGVAFFAVSLTKADLIGADRPLAIWLGVAPAIVGSVLLLTATFIESSVFVLYLLGNITVFFQVAWVILLGIAFIRKGDSLDAISS